MDDERRSARRRSLGRLTLIALAAAAFFIFFVPVRCRLPTTFTVLFDPGFTGPFRIVADGRCDTGLVREGFNYTVRIPDSGQIMIGDPVFLSPPRRGAYVGRGDSLPQLGSRAAASQGVSPFILRTEGQHWTLIGFVGSPAEYARIGGYAGLQDYFQSTPLPECRLAGESS